MRTLVIVLLSTTWVIPCAGSEVFSEAANLPARFIIADPRPEPNGEVQLLVEGKKIWGACPGYGTPRDCEVVWSPGSTKAAISVRSTKWTSEIHILDVWGQKRELPIPDIAGAARALNGQHRGRYLLMSPSGWVDEDHVQVQVHGNLVDSGTDGVDELNFSYVFLIELSTQRVLSVTCTSQHNLNCKRLIEPRRPAEPSSAGAPEGR